MALSLPGMAAGPDLPADCRLERGARKGVVRVVDAATLLLDDRTEVRLIGALTEDMAAVPGSPARPETDGLPPPQLPASLARRLLGDLALGRTVELFHSGSRSDRYGRLPAQVVAISNGERVWLQGALVARGLARAYALADHAGCLAPLIRLEAAARAQKLGLWANAAYAVRPAWRTGELRRYRHTFQLVEGRVQRVSHGKGQTYLNFGRDWRSDFTITIRAGVRRTLAAAGIDLTRLQGRVVRVRGWLIQRNGPLIEISQAEELEVVEDTDATFPPRRPEPDERLRKRRRPDRSDPGAGDL
ncbi:MAG: thermonuclease family protein [Hyphomicrobiaceae bacterium]